LIPLEKDSGKRPQTFLLYISAKLENWRGGAAKRDRKEELGGARSKLLLAQKGRANLKPF